jgi:hypothetical protein
MTARRISTAQNGRMKRGADGDGEHDNLVITGEHVKAGYPLRYPQLSAHSACISG